MFHQDKFVVKLLAATALSTFGAISYAQEAPTEEDRPAETKEDDADARLDTIVVRGIRGSAAENLALKREAEALIDAITAEDIGKFPDKNVADALQRVPGVTIERSGGEGNSVSIRGLASDLTLSLLNGNFIASSAGEPSRSFDYNLLPSTLVERVEVFKSSEARLEEGGVGGTVIVHSRKPFDVDAGTGRLSVEGTWGDTTEQWDPSVNGFYSWKNESETFGILASYTRQDRLTRTMTGSAPSGWRYVTASGNPNLDANGNPLPDSTARFNPFTTADGRVIDGVWVPQAVFLTVAEEDRVREGFQITGQWKPIDRLTLTGNYFNFSLKQDQTFSQLWFQESQYQPAFLNDITVGDDNVATGIFTSVGASGAERPNSFPALIGRFRKQENTSDTYDITAEWDGDWMDVKFVAGRSEAEGGPSELFRVGYYNNSPQGNAAQFAAYEIGEDRFSFQLDPATPFRSFAGAGGDVDLGQTTSSFVIGDINSDYYQLDVDFDLDWGLLKTLRVGAKRREIEIHRETNNVFFVPPERAAELAANPDDFNSSADEYRNLGGVPSYQSVAVAGGIDNIPGGFNVNYFPGIDMQAYRAAVLENFAIFRRREPNFVYDVAETNTAGYVQGDFEFSNFRGNLGVRYVEIEADTSSADIVTFFFDEFDDELSDEATNTAVRLPLENRLFDFFDVLSQTSTEDHLLPSFNLVWDVTDNFIARFAAAQTMSRPGLNALGSQQRLAFVSPEVVDDFDRFTAASPVRGGFTGSGGNKNLKSFESDQFDLSLEYYYGEGSGLGIAFFRKDVDNFIVPLTISTPFTFQGVTAEESAAQGRTFADGTPFTFPAGTYTIETLSTSGNGSNATSEGVEVFIQHFFDNGFGFSGNYTLNDTNQADVTRDGEKVGESPLVGSSDYQMNASLFYENDRFGARVSYNKRGEQNGGLFDGLPIINRPYQQVDANANFDVTDALTLTASVINLTEEEQISHIGDDTESRLLSTTYSGRRFYVGANYKF